MMVTLLNVLGTALRLWEHNKKSEYLEEYIKLREIIYEQRKLPTLERDNIVLGDALERLRILSEAFINTSAASADSFNSSR